MGQYWSRWKFKNSDGKICEAFFEDGSLVKSVHAINKLDGSTYYIANCFGNASSADGYKWLEDYKIVGDTIEQVCVVDGEGKVNTSDSEDESFAIEFYIPNDYYVHDGSSYKWTFEYDPQTKDFYIPLFTDGDFFRV